MSVDSNPTEARNPVGLLWSRTCGDHPHVLQMLTDLACELALNYGRAVDDGVTFRVHAPAPDSKTQWPAFDALRATLRNCPKAVAGKV